MEVGIDRVGRVVIPKPIRDRLHLRGGETLLLEECDGVIELRPKSGEYEIVETPEGPVLRALGDVPPLTDEMIRETLEQVRERR